MNGALELRVLSDEVVQVLLLPFFFFTLIVEHLEKSRRGERESLELS